MPRKHRNNTRILEYKKSMVSANMREVRPKELFTGAEKQLRRRSLEQALRLFDVAEQAGFDADACAAHRWTCHMLRGDFELAWRESERIAKRGNPDPQQFWDGQPLSGRKILIRCLHGLGDTLQFIRYAPLIRKEARSLAIEAQPQLKLLLQEAQIADEVITWGEQEPAWDQQIEVIELPRIFRTTIKSIPKNVPYLKVRSHGEHHSNSGARALRVGIAWAAGTYNPARSIPLAEMAPLFSTPHVCFFSLQGCAEPIHELCDESTPVSAVAQILNTLDLVIAVDTMLAHLAGAMARPVWTLLPYECDWRWMIDRQDSPWYPTMRLFRQPRPEDWHSVIKRAQAALETFAASIPDSAEPQLQEW